MKNVHLCYEGGKREYFSPEAILNAAIIDGGKICLRHEGESQVLCNLMLLNRHIKEVNVYAFVLGRFNIVYKGLGFYPRNHSLNGVFSFPMYLK